MGEGDVSPQPIKRSRHKMNTRTRGAGGINAAQERAFSPYPMKSRSSDSSAVAKGSNHPNRSRVAPAYSLRTSTGSVRTQCTDDIDSAKSPPWDPSQMIIPRRYGGDVAPTSRFVSPPARRDFEDGPSSFRYPGVRHAAPYPSENIDYGAWAAPTRSRVPRPEATQSLRYGFELWNPPANENVRYAYPEGTSAVERETPSGYAPRQNNGDARVESAEYWAACVLPNFQDREYRTSTPEELMELFPPTRKQNRSHKSN